MASLGADPEFYGAVRRQRRALVQASTPRERAVPQPRARQPAGRPQEAGPRGRRRLRPRREGARRRHGRQRREDAGDGLGAHARDLRRAEQRDAAREGQGRGLRARLHRPDGHARRRSCCAAAPTRRPRDSPFDHPLSSRFDENDAVIVFDNAFIPWENVLVYRDVERANSLLPRSRGSSTATTLQAGTRLGVKLDFMAGLFACGIATNGTDEFRGVQVALGDLLGLAQPHLGAHDGDVRSTRARARATASSPSRSTPPLVRVFAHRSLRRRFNERSRPDPGRQPARHPVERRGSAEPGAAPAHRPLLPRLGRLGRRAGQALQADLGRDRQRVRRRATSSTSATTPATTSRSGSTC